ncbi:MAG: Flagellar basal body-associated protein FliL [Verrucomicrobia bacterium]|nr:MAG: Flagellar basal body-associated protein FliL [Verrucomicrobiota bacterium]
MSEEAADPSQDPTAEGAAPAKKGGSPMIPLLVAVVASTAISFVMVKFIFAPAVEKKIRAELAPVEEAADGAVAAAPAKDAHGAPAAPAKDAHGAPAAPAKDAHGAPAGEKSGKETGLKQTKGGWEYGFPNVVSNLTGSLGTKYVKVSFTVLSDDKNIGDIVEENKSKLKDAAIRVLGSRSLADMESSGAKNVLCSEIAANFNKALDSNSVKQIFLTEFLIQ